jgi:DNA-binding winged helix-turn-helix (wHTH) protein/TolB-like protein
MDPTRLAFGPFELDIVSRELRHGHVCLRLQEQPFQLLRILLAHPGAVVTRDALRRHLWPDGTFVDFEHSLNAAIRRLRVALADNVREPRFIETVPGRGYRWRLAPDPERAVRLAVLPFAVSRGEDDFAAGLFDELIAQIGQHGGERVQVIARTSTLALTRTANRAAAIGELLAADYLLEGSIRRHGERARIPVWLVDARQEVQTWREVYDRRVAEPVEAPAELACTIAQSVVAQLAHARGETAVGVSVLQLPLEGVRHLREELPARSFERVRVGELAVVAVPDEQHRLPVDLVSKKR